MEKAEKKSKKGAIYLELFLTFAKVGVCTFGGGYAMLPVLQRMVAEDKKWCTSEELADYYAVGQCTPGIIAINTATFAGSKQAGVLGGISATLGLVFPSLVIITFIAAFLKNFTEIVWIRHAFNGIRAGVVALILSSVVKLFKSAAPDLPTRIIYVMALALAIVGEFLLDPSFLGYNIISFICSPAVIVILGGIAGVCIRTFKEAMEK